MHTMLPCLAGALAWLTMLGGAGLGARERASMPASVQETLRVAPFRSLAARNGAHVSVRPGAQRVTLVRGSLAYSRVAVSDRGELVIDRCARGCPRGYRLDVEIVTPGLDLISLADGGMVESRGSFPPQRELDVTVSSGGTIDVRALEADRVTARVEQGGRILTEPRSTLSATVSQGGIITYWGDPRVRSSVQHGGVVNRGGPAGGDPRRRR